MRFLIHLDDHITWLDARVLISLPVEDVLLTIWCTLIDLCLKDLFLLDHLLSLTCLALVLLADDLALAIAFIARSSTLCVHARAEHLHNGSHSATLAARACLYSTSLSTGTIALGANTVSIDYDLGCFATVKIS